MEDEPKEHPDDIESILSDLDAILTDMGGAVPPAAEPPEAGAAPPPLPPPPPPPPPPKAEPSPKAATPEPESPKIELAPRAGMITPAVRIPAPPKPAPRPPIEISAAAPPAAAPAPSPASPPPAVAPAASAPVPPAKPSGPPRPAAPAPAAVEELPAGTPKDQIRRVAYAHTSACADAERAFAVFLSAAARTISKKPLFLREVLSHEVGNSSDPDAILEKAKQAKAVAILALVEGWPPVKTEELSEACARAGLLFRLVSPADTQKKSTAVDIIVDMMLLPGEA